MNTGYIIEKYVTSFGIIKKFIVLISEKLQTDVSTNHALGRNEITKINKNQNLNVRHTHTLNYSVNFNFLKNFIIVLTRFIMSLRVCM